MDRIVDQIWFKIAFSNVIITLEFNNHSGPLFSLSVRLLATNQKMPS